MDINLKSAFLCSKYTIPHMIKQGKGSIINVASFVAFIGCTVPQDAYTASKGGMSLTKSFAVQYGRHGIRCNAICPGPIETPLLRVLWTSEEPVICGSIVFRSVASGRQKILPIWRSTWPPINPHGQRAHGS